MMGWLIGSECDDGLVGVEDSGNVVMVPFDRFLVKSVFFQVVVQGIC